MVVARPFRAIARLVESNELPVLAAASGFLPRCFAQKAQLRSDGV
jgi:hypothetical protein